MRVTPIHPWHVAHGAVFENVGQWKRPRYYPQGGESMDEAVLRECAAARERVAAMDASTLGKIDVQGPDAVEFLNRLYTNAYDTLAVGKCRYGVMCKPDGMVFDDGVVMRVGERALPLHDDDRERGAGARLDGGVAPDRVARAPRLADVGHRAVGDGRRRRAGLACPARRADRRSRSTTRASPSWRSGRARSPGIPARVCRISFSGELAYEVNVDGRRGLELWEAVLASGEVTPYGTEAMHVLRAEKGYPIIGQETDGTVTPHDLGMELDRLEDEAGLPRQALVLAGRHGARRPQAARRPAAGRSRTSSFPRARSSSPTPGIAIPIPMLGHVTSSYRSAALGRTFALALVESGRERIGETVYAPLPDRTIAVEIVDPVLYDPEGARRDGRPD